MNLIIEVKLQVCDCNAAIYNYTFISKVMIMKGKQ